MKYVKSFGEFVNENYSVFEATVEMDAMDPDNKEFLKFLKKNKVKIINKEMSGPGGGAPVITMQGKRKDLEKVLADGEYGWDDPDLAEYIKEFINEGVDKWVIENDKGLYFNYYFKKFTSKLNKFSTYKDEEWAKRDADKHGGEVKKLGK